MGWWWWWKAIYYSVNCLETAVKYYDALYKSKCYTIAVVKTGPEKGNNVLDYMSTQENWSTYQFFFLFNINVRDKEGCYALIWSRIYMEEEQRRERNDMCEQYRDPFLILYNTL